MLARCCADSSTGPTACLQLVEGFMPECDWLDDEETLTYLHSTDLDQAPSRSRARDPDVSRCAAGRPAADRRPRADARRSRICACSRSSAFRPRRPPGLLDELNRLAFPYRWSTRAIMLDKTDATKLLTRIRRQWFAKRKSIARDPQGGDDQRGVDAARHRRRQQGDRCRRGAAGAGLRPDRRRPMSPRPSPSGTTIPRIADEKLRLVEKVIQGRDFTCMRETRERRRGLARQPARAMSMPTSASRRSRPSTSRT